jgi:hypothetical protein
VRLISAEIFILTVLAQTSASCTQCRDPCPTRARELRKRAQTGKTGIPKTAPTARHAGATPTAGMSAVTCGRPAVRPPGLTTQTARTRRRCYNQRTTRPWTRPCVLLGRSGLPICRELANKCRLASTLPLRRIASKTLARPARGGFGSSAGPRTGANLRNGSGQGFAKAIMPLIVVNPRAASAIAEGALMRHECGAKCFERYRKDLNREVCV